ncbi:MAG: xanthine dehydrogenase family protein subunit M [Sulfobacillus acidophilus]|uniref:Xanthine dehydrogenase family protein subunit M n=1 Tax=Sulfobacillus acidophilus TaxID=53633 RepID=A0A2T2WE55_9FIRM|nr:MAG: xanthine dehydrogenase family protein subunit M [Sulfobacillus acidophilus]
MKPPAFDYYRPESISEATSLLKTMDDAKILAGGQSLIPMMNMRLARPQALIDINRIQALTSINDQGESLRVGALVRHCELETNPLVQRYVPLVSQAEGFIGHTAIRSRGTIGGSLAHADPAAELPVLAVLYDWDLIVESADQTRTIPARDFFLSYFITALDPTEILTAIDIPKQNGRGHISEYAIRAGDFALAIAAVSVRLTADNLIDDVRVALGGVADVPWRDPQLEEQWRNQSASPDLWRDIAHVVSERIEPTDDLQASAAYRRQLAETLVYRALQKAYRDPDAGSTMEGSFDR